MDDEIERRVHDYYPALTAERDALRSRVAELEATIDPLFDAAKKGPGHVID